VLVRWTQHTPSTVHCGTNRISNNNHRFVHRPVGGGNPCVPDRAAVARCSDLGLPETIPLIKWASP